MANGLRSGFGGRKEDPGWRDTEFRKATCVLDRFEDASPITGVIQGGPDFASLSMVFSGDDLTNSIHRPERCMKAQGHEIYDSEATQIVLSDGRTVPVRRLLSFFKQKTDDSGGFRIVHALTYYFFAGHGINRITEDHSARNKMDMRDRLMMGEAQHWAYVLVTMTFAEDDQAAPAGPLLPLVRADKKLLNLLSELCERNIDWSMVKN